MSERDDLLRLIEADLDGEIDADARARLDAALRDDPTLAAEAAELRRLRSVFRAVPPVCAPPGFAADVRSAVVKEPASDAGTRARPGGSRPRILRAAPWIAGLAAATLLALMLGPWTADDDRFAPRDAPVQTADVPALDAEAAREDLERTRYAESRERREPVRATRPGAPAGSENPSPAKSAKSQDPVRAARGVVDRRDDLDDELADAGDAAGKSEGFGMRRAMEETAESVEADDGAPGGATSTPLAPPEREAGPVAENDAPDAPGAPQPVKPSAPRSDTRLAGRAPPGEGLDLVRAGVPETAPRYYVAFEDEAAARRFLAALQPAGEKKAQQPTDAGAKRGSRTAAETASVDGARGGAADDAKDAGDAGGVAGGGGGAGPRARGLTSSSTSAALPRVLERVTLQTTDPVVGRALSRAPSGGVFGDALPVALLDAAEARFKLAERARRKSRGATPDPVADAESGEPAESTHPGGPTTGGATAGEPSTGAGAAAPADGAGERQEDAGAMAKKAGSFVEIVVVIVPAGTLPTTRGAAPSEPPR